MSFNPFRKSFFTRDSSHKLGRQPIPTNRPVRDWWDWDALLPRPFPEPDMAWLTERAMAKLHDLLERAAIDVQVDILDGFIAEVFAAEYEAAMVRFNLGMRNLELLDQQAIEVCNNAMDDAEQARAAAVTTELAADTVYQEVVGSPRIKTDRTGKVNWDDLAARFRDHRLMLEADSGILDYARRGFRGNGPTPTKPIDSATTDRPVGADDATIAPVKPHPTHTHLALVEPEALAN